MMKIKKRRVRVRQKECNGCMSCQVYCSTAKEGFCSPMHSRVRVQLDPFDAQHRISICRQCEKAACVEACPEKAIVPSADGTYWVIDYERCTNCRECMEACPFDSIFYDPVANRVFRCDTCEGAPLCAQVCPMGALTWDEE